MYKVFIDDRQIQFIPASTPKTGDSKSVEIECFEPIQIREQINSFVDDQSASLLVIRYNEYHGRLLQQLSKIFIPVRAAGGLVVANNHFLFIFRHGKWDLPKGKPHKKESLKTTAIREVMEETGIESPYLSRKIGKTYHLYNEHGRLHLKISHWYEMICKQMMPVVPQVDEDITRAEWVHRDKLEPVLNGAYASIRELIRSYLNG